MGKAGRDHWGSPGPTSLLKSYPRAHDTGFCPEGFWSLQRRSLHNISRHSHSKALHIQVELFVFQFSSFKWVRDAEASFTRQCRAYLGCRTPAEAAAAPCQQLLLWKGRQLLWVLPHNNTCKSLSTPQCGRGFLLSRSHRTGWGRCTGTRCCLLCPISQAMALLTAIKFTQLFPPYQAFQ